MSLIIIIVAVVITILVFGQPNKRISETFAQDDPNIKSSLIYSQDEKLPLPLSHTIMRERIAVEE